jgi:AAA15 family ATPase/GTPase
MLVSFTVGNYLSFKDKQTLDLIPDALKEHINYLHIPYLYSADARLLKSVGIYGHNSHGKSNFLKSYQFFLDFIFTSFSIGRVEEAIKLDNFRLNTVMRNRPSFFEVVFYIRETKYRYGFEVTSERVVSEWLFYAEAGVRENYLFYRGEQETKISKTWSRDSEQRNEQLLLFTKKHNLFLSVLCSQENIPRVKEIEEWLKGNMVICDYGDEKHLKRVAIILSQLKYRSLVSKFIDDADLGFISINERIDSLTNKRITLDKNVLDLWFADELKSYDLFVKHDVYDEHLKKVETVIFDLLKDESAGTVKFVIIACYLAYAIKNGQLILVDELDSQFHVQLLKFIVQIFHDPKNNNAGAQMIFTTHNTVLLSDRILRRDQITFVEKNEFSESRLRKMHTAKQPVRIDAPIEKNYIKGKLGGTSKKLKSRVDDQNSLFKDLE